MGEVIVVNPTFKAPSGNGLIVWPPLGTTETIETFSSWKVRNSCVKV
jgi:hypothetical protein